MGENDPLLRLPFADTNLFQELNEFKEKDNQSDYDPADEE